MKQIREFNCEWTTSSNTKGQSGLISRFNIPGKSGTLPEEHANLVPTLLGHCQTALEASTGYLEDAWRIYNGKLDISLSWYQEQINILAYA